MVKQWIIAFTLNFIFRDSLITKISNSFFTICSYFSFYIIIIMDCQNSSTNTLQHVSSDIYAVILIEQFITLSTEMYPFIIIKSFDIPLILGIIKFDGFAALSKRLTKHLRSFFIWNYSATILLLTSTLKIYPVFFLFIVFFFFTYLTKTYYRYTFTHFVFYILQQRYVYLCGFLVV